ncbi:MAG: hypothetical protein AB1673_06480 [Actinomycetota bacterium]
MALDARTGAERWRVPAGGASPEPRRSMAGPRSG